MLSFMKRVIPVQGGDPTSSHKNHSSFFFLHINDNTYKNIILKCN